MEQLGKRHGRTHFSLYVTAPKAGRAQGRDVLEVDVLEVVM
jgi:hypothetical protein